MLSFQTKCYSYILSLPWPPPPKRCAGLLCSTSPNDLLAETKQSSTQKKRQKQKSQELLGVTLVSNEMVQDPRTRKVTGPTSLPENSSVSTTGASLSYLQGEVPNIYWGYTVCQVLCGVLQKTHKWAHITDAPHSCLQGLNTNREQ